jgi:hypothetical protein
MLIAVILRVLLALRALEKIRGRAIAERVDEVANSSSQPHR